MMELTVEFKSNIHSGQGNVIFIETDQSIGLASLKQIREASGVPNLSIQLVSQRVDSGDLRYYLCTDFSILEKVVIKVSEDFARTSGRFCDSGKCEVIVPEKSLNRFVITGYTSQIDSATGEIKVAGLEYKIQKNEMLRDWADAGYPLEWTEV